MIDAEKFWARVDRTGTCWEWMGARRRGGYPYGWYRVDGRMVRAHRYAYELANGPIPAGLNVLHACDNPPCVRPDHLRVGTQRDNMTEMTNKGRRKSSFVSQHQTGSANNRAKLTEDDVRQIRALSARGVRQKDIAAQFGIARNNVSVIVRRHNWSHI